MKRRFATAVLTILFLSVMFGALFNLSQGMGMMGDMSNCPFMAPGEVLCSMNVLDHFTAWESAFTVILPTFVLLSLALTVVWRVLKVAPNLLLRYRLLAVQRLFSTNYSAVFTHLVRPWQELFSQGILHPKLF